MTADRLIQWEQFQFRIRGERLVAVARTILAGKRLPLELDGIDFREGDAEVTGKVRKGIPVPFRFHLREIEARGTTVRVPIEGFTVLGFLPVPGLLFRIADAFTHVDGVAIDAERKAIIISMDRFLPPFVDADLASIRVIGGGILVTLAGGGADVPIPGGGFDGQA
ncbi:MAG: hypothetical protein ACRD2J_18190 [Thermoanaerobaculia bacterium]